MAVWPFSAFSRRSPQTHETKSSLAYPDDAKLALFGASPSASGIAVTPKSAMSVPAVRCGVQAIAEGIGQLPVHVYSRSEDGSKERAPKHPAQSLLHDAANDWTPASEFREELTRDALLHNGGFAYINRIDGKPVELTRLDPSSMAVTSANGEPVYSFVGADNTRRTIPRENILHIRPPGGVSPITQCKEAIGLALVLEQYAARLFGNGARPSGVLSLKGANVGPEALAKIKAAWQSAHGGDKSGSTAVLPTDAEWQSLALTSVDAQFLEMRAFAIAEIARLLRVPPIFLMDYGRATWGNSEEMGKQFLTYTLLPWINRWEGEIQLKLIAPQDRGTFFAEFLTDDLLRADIDARADAYTKLIAARVLNPNEARAMENRPSYEGGDRFENPNTISKAAA
jgi:HK97 family phage portal protein